jgi:hypothetical protein
VHAHCYAPRIERFEASSSRDVHARPAQADLRSRAATKATRHSLAALQHFLARIFYREFRSASPRAYAPPQISSRPASPAESRLDDAIVGARKVDRRIPSSLLHLLRLANAALGTPAAARFHPQRAALRRLPWTLPSPRWHFFPMENFFDPCHFSRPGGAHAMSNTIVHDQELAAARDLYARYVEANQHSQLTAQMIMQTIEDAPSWLDWLADPADRTDATMASLTSEIMSRIRAEHERRRT